MDHKKYLTEVIQDITENALRIKQYIADNLKRSEGKDCKCHSAWYACDYCFAKGVKIDVSENSSVVRKLNDQVLLIEEKIQDCESLPEGEDRDSKIQHLRSLKEDLQKTRNSLKRKTNILWPHSTTVNSQHRSRQSILNIVEKIENKENLSIDESKGIMGRSPLLDVPNFNFTYDVPAEYLHSGCLGVTKKLVELTFNVGTARPRITTRKLSTTAKFNKLMSQVKVIKEFPRRARYLDFAVFKGQEFRNLALFFFILILECIEEDARERLLWLNLAYMFRSSVIPSEEFSEVQLSDVTECCETFYKIFEQLFGEQNCTYNIHVFIGHLLEIRTHGPLTETSAFKFESFYGEIRRSFVPNTISPLKQIMKNIFLKRSLENHHCTNNIFLSNYETALESNKYVYCFSSKKYKIYEISEINGNNISCYKIGQYPATFPETPNLNWSKVGVFKKGGKCNEVTNLNPSNIHGKVIVVGKYLLTCPHNIINEK